MSFTLKIGDKGQEVRRLQIVLGITPDGDFGPNTELDVKRYQAAANLKQDGIAGCLTLEKLGINPLLGIDVSHWQGKIDWKKVAADGVRYAFVKATQATGYHDPKFAVNVKGAKDAGIPVGAYHFAVATLTNAKEEAKNFLESIAKVGELDLPCVLDMETDPNKLTSSQLEDWCLDWTDEVKKATGKKPILYTGCSFIMHQLDNCTKLSVSGVKLWVARYHGINKVEPADEHLTIGKYREWTMWQFDQVGKVDGISGHVDRNWLPRGERGLTALRNG